MDKISIPMQIKGVVQHYSWGLVRDRSLVAALAQPAVPETEPCAELWFGTHPRGAAEIVAPAHCVGSLRALLQELPLLMLGKDCAENFGAQLPFLFKILSVATALSIQAHPDVSLAKKLHERHPEHYPDANHKPEMAIAISELELLYGFRPRSELVTVLFSVSELVRVIPEELWQGIITASTSNTFSAMLRNILQHILNLEASEVGSVCEALRLRWSSKESKDPHEDLFLRLAPGYPKGDAGLLAMLLMNLVRLEPGQAIFIGANVPHAYLNGELVECMSNSDNVVRAGLTGKFKDVSTLVDMLSYELGAPEFILPSVEQSGALCYRASGVREFGVRSYAPGRYSLDESQGPRVLLSIGAEGELRCAEELTHRVVNGAAFFLPANLSDAVELFFHAGIVYEAFVPGR